MDERKCMRKVMIGMRCHEDVSLDLRVNRVGPRAGRVQMDLRGDLNEPDDPGGSPKGSVRERAGAVLVCEVDREGSVRRTAGAKSDCEVDSEADVEKVPKYGRCSRCQCTCGCRRRLGR